MVAALFVSCAYAAGGLFVPYLLALNRVRIEAKDESVRISGVDPGPMAFCGFVALTLTWWAWRWGVVAFALTGAVSLVTLSSLRVTLTATRGLTTLRRTVLYVVPWRTWRGLGPPRAVVDGWGDWFDPETLMVRMTVRDREKTVELGWGSRSSAGTCSALAEAINRSLEGLSPPSSAR